MIESLNASDPGYARATFNTMPKAQQDALLSAGYQPPGDDKDPRGGGWGPLGWTRGILFNTEVPGTAWLKRGVQNLVPGIDTTGGNFKIGSYSGA